VIRWVGRFRETGSVRPGQIGGHKPKKIRGAHRDWLIERCRNEAFTLRGLVAELAERGLKVDYRSVWAFVHDEKLSYKKRRWSRPNRGHATDADSLFSRLMGDEVEPRREFIQDNALSVANLDI